MKTLQSGHQLVTRRDLHSALHSILRDLRNFKRQAVLPLARGHDRLGITVDDSGSSTAQRPLSDPDGVETHLIFKKSYGQYPQIALFWQHELGIPLGQFGGLGLFLSSLYKLPFHF